MRPPFTERSDAKGLAECRKAGGRPGGRAAANSDFLAGVVSCRRENLLSGQRPPGQDPPARGAV